MFERRPILGLILGLNVCVLIWRISVQEQNTLDTGIPMGAYSMTGGSIGQQQNVETFNGHQYHHRIEMKQQHMNLKYRTNVGDFNNPPSHEQQLHAGKHLLAETVSWNESVPLVTERTLKLAKKSKRHKADHSRKSRDQILSQQQQQLRNPIDVVTVPPRATIAPQATESIANVIGQQAFPAADFAQLIDITDFHYTMVQPECAEHIVALILVHSAPHYHDKRKLIRTTWGSVLHGTPMRLIFLLGGVHQPTLQSALEEENRRYGDMVQGSFIDDYRNMTYKHMMAFKWFLYNCTHAQILIKVDDDVFVNTPQMLKYLKEGRGIDRSILTGNANATVTTAVTYTAAASAAASASASAAASAATDAAHSPPLADANFKASQTLFRKPNELLFCEEYVGSLAKRSYRSKWRVSFKEYNERYYPPYCPGYAIIYSTDVIRRLYRAAQQQKYFWIDDVFMTGIVAQLLNISITTSAHYVLSSENCEHLLDGKTDFSNVEFLFAWHYMSPQRIDDLWSSYLRSQHHRLHDNTPYKMGALNAPIDIANSGNTFSSGNYLNSFASYLFKRFR